MALDPGAAAHLDAVRSAGVRPVEHLSVAEARLAGGPLAPRLAGPPEDVHEVVNSDFTGPAGPLPVRFYLPRPGTLSLVVYFHGGGWVVGSIDSHDGVCRALSRRGDVAVASVDYRLAPEHKFPAAVDDAWAAVGWLTDNAGRYFEFSGDIAVAGDSTGAGLATVVATRAARRAGPHLAGQLLFYPVLDCGMQTRSWVELADGYLLTTRAMRWYLSHYLRDPAQVADPEVSPLRASDLTGAAFASILTCEFDPLRDEGEAYARRLQETGVTTNYRCYPGLIHGALRKRGVMPTAQAMVDDAASDIRSWFAPRGTE